jgi:uncharacterized membrane protein
MRTVVTVLAVALTISYPLAVYFGLTRLGTRSVVVLLAFLMLAGAILQKRKLSELKGVLAAGFVLALTAFFNEHRFLLATPVLINLGLLATFGGSLRTETPIVEKFARMQVSDLSAEEVRYCRSVTQVWSGFFVLNGTAAAVLALTAPLAWWALYTGLIAYVLIGLLGASEYVIRKRRFGRFGDNPIDRALRAVLVRRGAPG